RASPIASCWARMRGTAPGATRWRSSRRSSRRPARSHVKTRQQATTSGARASSPATQTGTGSVAAASEVADVFDVSDVSDALTASGPPRSEALEALHREDEDRRAADLHLDRV